MELAQICATCHLPIEGECFSAFGKHYHPDHFICCICMRTIRENVYYQRDGLPICKKDYEASCPICVVCSQPILDEQVIGNGKYFHPEHFVCHLCDTQITDEGFHEKNGKMVCHYCYLHRYADKCKGCKNPIIDRVILALNAKWHPECFKCTKCSKVIKSRKYKIDVAGDPICEGC